MCINNTRFLHRKAIAGASLESRSAQFSIYFSTRKQAFFMHVLKKVLLLSLLTKWWGEGWDQCLDDMNVEFH